MAIVTVVENPSSLERQMLLFLRQMTEHRGDFTLAMLLPSEAALPDKWNLVVSAIWIDRDGLRAVIPTITSSLQKQLSKVNARKIERISVLPTTDPLVATMVSFRVPLGKISLVEYFPQAEGAIVLLAEPPSTSRNYQAQPAQTRA
jgi:hypothetical protein